MKRFLSASMALLLLALACVGSLTFLAAAEEGSGALPHPFIKSGLVAYYEGTQNTRDGHDTASSVWEDLAGDNDMTVTVDEQNYFAEDGYHLNSIKNYFPTRYTEPSMRMPLR